MAERLSSGLQNRVPGFNSPSRLNKTIFSFVNLKKSFLKFLVGAVFVSALFFISLNSLAAEIKVEKVEAKPITFTPQITIPGSEIFKKGVPFTITKETMPTMARDLYKFLVGSAGMVAVIVMMAGGYLWIFAGGNTARVGQAKDYIGGAVVGLTLALGSYMILNMINPDLINMKNFEIPTVPKITVLGILECPGEEKLVELKPTEGLKISISNMEESDDGGPSPNLYFNSSLVDALTKAAKKARENGYTIVVTSGRRTLDYQKVLYQNALNGGGNKACPSSALNNKTPTADVPVNDFCGCPHVTGSAVDVCLEGGEANPKMCKGKKDEGEIDSSKNNEYKNKGPQTFLKSFMMYGGFKGRLCTEWWHFELPKVSGCLE